MAYYRWKDEDGRPYGSFEVFHVTRREALTYTLPGEEWYHWACLPGCLPDGEANGPFDTRAAAIEDARGDSDYQEL